MTINSFYDSQFYASINHYTGTRGNQSMQVPRCDITCPSPCSMLLQLPKSCGRFMSISITMHVQMHVHNGIKISSLRTYVAMYN